MEVFEVAACVGYRAGDGVAVGAGGGIVQAGDDTRFYCARDEVFQATGFFMDLVPLHAQHVDQESFCESMSSQYCFGCLIASFRE